MGGKSSDPNKAAMRAQKDQMERLDALDLPELKQYMLQNPELVGLLDAENIDPSKLGDIALDPKLRDNQMGALEALKERADEGLTATDKYSMEKMLGDVSANERSQQAAIEADMARKGMDSSGAALMSKLQSKQSGANNARDRAMQMAAMGQQNRMSALSQLGQQSGQMNRDDFNRQSQIASAQDAIQRANAMNRQNVSGQNLAARQSIENQRAGTANQQSQVENKIAQQNFNNQISKATGQGSVANSMSNIAGNTPQGPSTMQQIGTIGGAIAGGMTGGSAGIGAGASAGGAIGGMFADGGIAQKENMPIQYQQQADMVEYKAAETKQHEGFKKKYMKRIQDEVMGEHDAKSKTPVKPEGETGHEGSHKLADGGVASSYGNGGVFKRNDVAFNKQADTYLNNKYLDAAALEAQLPQQNSGIDGEALLKGLGTVGNLLGRDQERRSPLELGDFSMTQPKNILADGGNVISPILSEDGVGIVDSGMESYAGDRVDAKINDGEVTINVPQQQRLMDLLRGKISVDELGTDDIVEGVPREYRDDMHEELGEECEVSEDQDSIQMLMKMLGK